MNIYSQVTGPELEALKKTYGRYGVCVWGGVLLLLVGAGLSQSWIGAPVSLTASAMLLFAGVVVLRNVDGVRTEIVAASSHVRLCGPGAHLIFASFNGYLLLGLGVLAALVGIAAIVRHGP